MDSLLANYASSDEEQEEKASVQLRINPQPNQNQEKIEEKIEDFDSGNNSNPIEFSLPPPKSYSLSLNPSNSQPSIRQQHNEEDSDDGELQRVDNRGENSKPSSLFFSLPQPKSSSSLFSSLPRPKAHVIDPQPSSSPKPKPETAPDPKLGASVKRVVQVRPPLYPAFGKYSSVDDEDENDDEDEREEEKRRKKVESLGQTASVKSFLSSIPAPRNSATLGALPSASGTGRRSIIKTSNSSSVSGDSEVASDGNVGGYIEGGQYVDGAPMSLSGGVSGSVDYAVAGGSSSSGDHFNWGAGNESYVNYDGYAGHGNVGYSDRTTTNGDYLSYGSDSGSYGNYRQYENDWSDVSTTMPAESELRLHTKRGRQDAPPQIVEVNQDELIKNRPREDQVKLTGIAFGPSYQPASTKGKPSKLHKRKHQIDSLYFDMKQKEMELAERRARGLLTKAQTQGKYGW